MDSYQVWTLINDSAKVGLSAFTQGLVTNCTIVYKVCCPLHRLAH